MKTFVSLSIVLAMAATAGAQTPAPAKPMVRIDLDAPATEAAPKAAPKQDAKKKKADEPPARIEGVTVARGTGFLGIQIVGGHFTVSFYDAKKKPVPPDVASAVLRWKVNYQPDLEHTQLTPGGGPNSLTSEKVIRQPYSFKLTLLLFKGAGENETPETLMADFQQ